LITTGSKPANLNIQGIENAITSDQFLEFESDHLPDKIVFMGGGYISFEFAHIAIRSSCKDITILHRGKQPLEHFDPDLVEQIVQRSQDGAGRVPNTKELDLNMGRIEYDDKGIKVNEFLQSISNPIVYAAGDVAATATSGGSPLTPAASYDGKIVANNLLYGNVIKFNYNGLPCSFYYSTYCISM